MKRILFKSVNIIVLLFISATSIAQSEPEKVIFKGQFNVPSYLLRTSDARFSNRRADDREYLESSKCALWLMDNYKVSFAFWTLLGEPVCDYKFNWNYAKSMNTEISHIFNNKRYVFRFNDLTKYPDLKHQFEYISPMPNIQIKVKLHFLNSDIRHKDMKEAGIAVCYHIINIDLADRAGITDNFSVPGSGSWTETFTDVNINESASTRDRDWLTRNNIKQGYLDPKDKETFERTMKIVFKNTKNIEVELSQPGPEIVALKWPVTEIMRILDEYCRREEKAVLAKTQPKKTTNTKKEDDLRNVTGSASTEIRSSDDDFWNSTKVLPEQWIGKLNKAEELYNQKQWTEARILYQEVAKINPNLSYASNKILFIDKLLNYKPKQEEVDYIDVRSENNPYLYGYKDKLGVLVIDYKYKDARNFSEGMAAIQMDNNKWGFISYDGTLIIPCTYDNVENFKDGKAFVHTIDNRKEEFTSSDCKNYHSAVALLWSDLYIDNNNKPVSEVKKAFRITANTAKGWDEESDEKHAACKSLWFQVAARLADWAVGQGYIEVDW